MSVSNFTEGLSPTDPNAVIWRFMELWKFQDMTQSGSLYFRRADKLEDEHEGMPPEQWIRTLLDYNRYDLRDITKLDHDLGSLAQVRQSYYLNCWYLFDEERAGMWARYGHDGVAVVSTCQRLAKVLEPLAADRPHLGLVRYGWEAGTRYNTQRFITTKRVEYAREREVRAALWLVDCGDAQNRHFDANNKPHRLPIYEPPPSLPFGITRPIDLRALVDEVVVAPTADLGMSGEIQSLVRQTRLDVAVRPSALTPFAHLLPTAEELSRYR